jgi:hypothetical protein
MDDLMKIKKKAVELQIHLRELQELVAGGLEDNCALMEMSDELIDAAHHIHKAKAFVLPAFREHAESRREAR